MRPITDYPSYLHFIEGPRPDEKYLILHDGCKDPIKYWFEDDGERVWCEVAPPGTCDEDCVLFRIGDCGTDREDMMCDRPFKPLDYDTAEVLCMIG